MSRAVEAFLDAAGVQRRRSDLRRTPRRTARAWRDHLLSGYAESPSEILEPLRASRGRDVVAVRAIQFVSVCPHHLLPFFGEAHIAYLPAGRVVGVSRLAALVRCLSRRLQIQEDLSEQIARELHRCTGARGAACIIEARHLCMTARAAGAGSGAVITAAFSGCYAEDARRRSQVIALLGMTGRRLPAGGRRPRRAASSRSSQSGRRASKRR